MTYLDTIKELETVMNRKLMDIPKRVRLWTVEYQSKNSLPKNMILTGLRGIGKSTFLLYHAQKSNQRMLYFSADNPNFSGENLYNLVSAIFMEGYDGVIIDEVHFAKDWSKHLKSLYDDYPDRNVWASDSSSLILRQGTADMSRRYVFVHMPFLSFREFLYLETGVEYECVDPFNYKKLPLEPNAKILSLFEEYKNHGTRPFYQEKNYYERSLAILEKTLASDVPFFVPHITDDNLRLMTSIVGTLSKAAIPRLQVRSLCADWNVGTDKLYQLLEVMEAVGVLKIIRFKNDNKAKSSGAKIFFADPCLYSVLNGNVGNQRESFVVTLFQESNYSVFACKDETEGDFLISKKTGNLQLGTNPIIKIEVGGKNKEPKSTDWVIKDNSDYPSSNGIPLWLLAMSW